MVPNAGAPGHRSRVEATANNLRIDSATAEVVAGLRLEHIDCIVLKGPSTQRWLYPDDARMYSDSDLLVDPARWEQAGGVLEKLGFAKRMDDEGMPRWWSEHAVAWQRATDQVFVDLHRWLSGTRVSAEEAWPVLSASTEALVVGGREVPVLAPHGRALQLAMHAAHHGSAWPSAVDDLYRAVQVADSRTWERAAALAARIGATQALAAGLRTTAAGAAVAAELQLPTSADAETTLRAATAPAVALGFERIARESRWHRRAAMVWRKLFPPKAFIRHWHPAAASSRSALVIAYLRRPFWVLRNAPLGWRAWRAAVRESRSLDPMNVESGHANEPERAAKAPPRAADREDP